MAVRWQFKACRTVKYSVYFRDGHYWSKWFIHKCRHCIDTVLIRDQSVGRLLAYLTCTSGTVQPTVLCSSLCCSLPNRRVRLVSSSSQLKSPPSLGPIFYHSTIMPFIIKLDLFKMMIWMALGFTIQCSIMTKSLMLAICFQVWSQSSVE